MARPRAASLLQHGPGPEPARRRAQPLSLAAACHWQSGTDCPELLASLWQYQPEPECQCGKSGPGLQLSAAPEAAMVKFMMMATAYK